MDLATAKRLLIPARYQTVLCLLISLVVLVVASSDTIYGRYIGNSFLNQPEFRTSFSTQFNRLSQVNLVDKFVIIIFWSGLGLIAYTVIWGLVNVLIEARNEVVVETAYTNRSLLHDRLKGPLLQAGFAIGLFAFLMICAKFLIPLWLSLFNAFVLQPLTIAGLLQGLAAWFGLAVMMYVIWVFTESVFAIN